MHLPNTYHTLREDAGDIGVKQNQTVQEQESP